MTDSGSYSAGGLKYTKMGLFGLFAWLLWGGVCFQLMESVLITLLPLQLRSIGASNQQMALMMTTIPGILGFLVGPAVSYKSDRSTHRWGRRKPFIIFTMPFLCLFLASIGFTEDIAEFFQQSAILKQWGISPLTATITLVGLLVLGFRFFDEFVNSVWWYMFRDVVPETLFGRFSALSRVVGAIGGFIWSLYIFPYAETNAREIYIWITLLYFFGFSLMCWRVKEERHQPSEEEAARKKPSIAAQVRDYARGCFGHPIYVWGYIGIVFDYFGNGLTFVAILFAKQLGITLEQLGVFGAFMGIANLLATYPAGIFADRFHPIRLCLITGTVTLVTPLLGYMFYQDWPSYMLLGLLWFPVSQIGAASGAILMMRVYPKKRYGQFCSCAGMIRGLSKMGGAVLGAYILDQLQDYRFYLLYNGALNVGTLVCSFIVYYYWKKCGGDHYVAPLKEENEAPLAAPTPPRPRRVMALGDYKLFAGSFALLAALVIALVLLISTFKQVMAVRWLSNPDDRSRHEVRQYVDILAEEKAVEALDRLRTRPDGMPSLFAAMALASKGDAGVARLRPEAETGAGERTIAAMAGLEYGKPGSLLPNLNSTADPAHWTASVQAATLADIYSSVDFIRDMDGLYIALFPGRKAIGPEVMGTYQRGLFGMFTSADSPNALTTALAFHGDQLRDHPELYKPDVLKSIQDSWVAHLTRTFEQRSALYAGQEAVRAAVAKATNLPPDAREAANRFLAGRYPGNPLTLTPAENQALPAGETLLRRDGGALRALALSADGGTRASGGFDNLARVWTAGKEAEPMVLAGHAFGVLAVAVSPDGARLATAGLDGTIRLWNSADGKQTAAVDAGTRRVSALAYSPDGATLAAGGVAGTIRLLDAVTGAERSVLRWHVAEVTTLAFTPDGKRLVAGCLDRSLSLWNLADPAAKPTVLERHGDAVWSLTMSPDGKWMASGAGDRRVILWKFEDNKPKPRVLKAHKSVVTALAASADGRWLASAGADRLLVVWDTEQGTVSSAHPTDVTVNAMRFEPDGKTLLLACEDGTLRRWTVAAQDERPFSFGDWALWLMRKD